MVNILLINMKLIKSFIDLSSWILILCTIKVQETKAHVILSPNNLTASEGSNGKIACIYTGSETLQGASFTVNDSNVATIFLPNCTYNALEITKFETDCTGNFSFELTWKNLSRTDQGNLIRCKIFSSGPTASMNIAMVYVNVPVKNVTITPERNDSYKHECEKSTHIFKCTTSAARPAPIIMWVFQDEISENKTFSVRGNETITNNGDLFITTSILSFVGNSSLHKRLLFCSASNIQNEEVYSRNIALDIWLYECNWTQSVDVERQVLYPPKVTEMKDLDILEGSMLNTSCNITFGKPALTTFSWTRQRDDFVLNSQFLAIDNVSRNDTSLYICSAYNNMTPTIGNLETGIDSGFFNLNVLYPPSISHIDDKYVKVGDLFELSCPVALGNPRHTQFIWTSHHGKQMTENQILSLTNVSKLDDTEYICTVLNTMSPTGLPNVLGHYNRSFHLHVEYEAIVDEFNLNGHPNITVNENERPTLICNVDSNPVSNIEIHMQNGTQLLLNDSNTISVSLGPVKCLDAGTYICIGRNKHNIVSSNRKVFLSVKCPPKAHPGIQISENITSSQGVAVVLRFFAVAYPAPSTVVWQKLNGLNWSTLIPDGHVSIKQKHLNYSLTINKVKMEDFGEYKLFIKNDLGSLEHIYNIIFEAKPDPPKGFKILTKLITPSSITVQWFPSFNGGSPQHFILNYSKSEVQDWRSVIIMDNEETIINKTIRGLESGTFYQLMLYAENSIGRSEHTNIFYIQTAFRPKERSELNVTGIFIGIGSFLVITFLGSILCYIWFVKKRRTPNQKTSGTNASKRISTKSFEENREMCEYDEIRMSQQINYRNFNETYVNLEDKKERESGVRYERLDEGKKKESYDPSYDHLDEKVVAKETSNVDTNPFVYMNLQI